MFYNIISAVHDCFFFFQAEDGIRDLYVTGVQTCALPISRSATTWSARRHREAPVTAPKPRKDFRQELREARVPPRTKCIRKFRKCESRNFLAYTLPGRCAEASAFRSRGIVPLWLGPKPHRGGASPRARTRPELLAEFARRFFRAGKYPRAFCDLLRARGFQYLCVRRRWTVPIRAALLPKLLHFFPPLQWRWSGGVGSLAAWA